MVGSRRSILTLVILTVFIAALLIATRRLSGQCPGGPYCPDFSQPQSGSSPAGDSVKVDDSRPADQPAEQPETTENEQNVVPVPSPQEQKPKIVDNDPNTAPFTTGDGPCTNFPDTSDILLTMKTGASEAFAKVPTQIITNLQCLPEYYIFSDMEQHIAGHKIYDSLDEVREDVISGNKDFRLYFRQKECAMDQQLCQKGYNLASEGWALDKYKFLHVAEKTYKMRPDYKWYLFTEADTYVVWSNMVDWLKQLDHREPLYLGSVAMLAGEPFGHGGSGYIMSNAIMREMFEGKTGVANKYDDKAPKTCCGDALFAAAVKNETGVKVQHTWPTINGEKPHTIPYADDEWCHPIATMHHVSSQDINDLATYERQRAFSGPLRIKDIYERFVQPHLKDTRLDWDNRSDDEIYLNSTSRKYSKSELDKAKKGDMSPLQESAHESFEACGKACESLDYCLQYRFHNGICGIGKKIRHGEPAKPEKEEDKKFQSGWDVKKINEWIAKKGECEGVKWPKVK